MKYFRINQVFIDGVVQKQWIFEETKLDDEHFVAVALNTASTQENIQVS